MVQAGVTDRVGLGRFSERLDAAVERSQSLVCVGLDPDLDHFPATLRREPDLAMAIVRFNAEIIEVTQDLVCAYKPNLGFYVMYGSAGIQALVETRRLIPPRIPVILDCKVGDMRSTAAAYARGYFEEWNFDAVTANGYLGDDSLAPFFAYEDRGVFVLSRTSNPGAPTFQDLPVQHDTVGQPLYLAVADQIARWADQAAATVGLVAGATYADALGRIRAHCPALPILLPGVGAQGGDLAASLAAGLDRRGGGLIASSSRAITYAGSGGDFAEQARAATLALRAEVAGAVKSKTSESEEE